jgi:hypothetical protein
MFIQKIISGGQTGVDQAALDAAMLLRVACGGWCPPGRTCETGRIPAIYPLKETPSSRSDAAPGIPRSLRTEWNVRDADAVLVLLPGDLKEDKGTGWTIQCAANYSKPILIVDPFETKANSEIKQWLKSNNIKTLNVAGPSEGSYPGIGDQTIRLLLAALT